MEYLHPTVEAGFPKEKIALISLAGNRRILVREAYRRVTNRGILDTTGVPVENMEIFVVKSRNHFREGFMESGLANTAIVIDAPGQGLADISRLPYRNIPLDTYSNFF